MGELKVTLKKSGWRMDIEFNWLRMGTNTVSYEHCNETSGFHKRREISHHLSYCQLLQGESAT
jgi:hypothetical protein